MSQSQATKRSYPKRSWTWKYFSLGQDQKLNCNICGVEVQYNKTTSCMISHLKHLHRITKNDTSEINGSNGIVSESDSSDFESNLENDQENIFSAKKRARIDKSVVDFIVKTCQPLSIVENENFKELMSVLNSKYSLPTRKTLTTSMIPNQVLLYFI